MNPKRFFTLFSLCLTFHALAQSPSLNAVLPLALRSGQTTTLTFSGQNLGGATELWTSFPAEIIHEPASTASDSDKSAFRVSLLPDVPVGIGAIRLATTHGVSSLQLLLIDDLPSRVDNGTNQTMETAQEITAPVAIDGNSTELGFDFYQISAQRGQRLWIEAVAQRIGSDLDPVLRLLDAHGRELAYCDDAPGLGGDARLESQISETGKYYVEVRDTRYKGGAKYKYHLRVSHSDLATLSYLPVRLAGFVAASAGPLPSRAELEPNSTVATANRIDVPATITGQFGKPNDRDFYEFQARQGQRLIFLGKTRSLGSPCDLFMRLFKADESLVAEANISGANEGSLTNTFSETGTYRLLVEELNHTGGPELEYCIDIEPLPPGFTLNVETDKVEAAAGGTCELKVSCSRREYSGPITLALAGDAGAFELGNNIFPAKTNETQLKLSVPAKLKPGSIVHFTVTGYAKVGDTYFETQASTIPALRKLFPMMIYPLQQLDGLIGLGVKAPEKPKEPVAAKAL